MVRSALRGRDYRNLLAVAAHAELHDPLDECKKRVVAPHPDIGAGVEVRPALANQDVAGDYPLAAEALDSQTLRVGIPPVAGRAGTLFGRKQLQIEIEHSRAIVAEPAQKAMTFAPARPRRGLRGPDDGRKDGNGGKLGR